MGDFLRLYLMKHHQTCIQIMTIRHSKSSINTNPRLLVGIIDQPEYTPHNIRNQLVKHAIRLIAPPPYALTTLTLANIKILFHMPLTPSLVRSVITPNQLIR